MYIMKSRWRSGMWWWLGPFERATANKCDKVAPLTLLMALHNQ